MPPCQRAVLVLRDVLGYHAAEVAEILETSEASVNSALQRARAALEAAPERPGGGAWIRMPPEPHEYNGRPAIREFLESRPLWGQGQRLRLVATRANGQPAFAYYLGDPQAAVCRAGGLFVLTLDGGEIAAITRFGDTGWLPYFGLPRTLPG
jgi:RNA polymerase sigma-70 factor, ECF subfamily